MTLDFVQDVVEEERPPRITGCLTGWELVIFELEDEREEPPPEVSS